MKKLLLICSLSLLCMTSFSQTCEEREEKLLESIGALAAGFLYNTYIAVGSISDAYISKSYNEELTVQLLTEQQSLIGNIEYTLGELIEKENMKNEADRKYLASVIDVMKGLRQQASLATSYVKEKDETKKNNYVNQYDQQRKKNWNQIAKALGIEED